MPAKKNSRKRTRDHTNDSSGPPKKRIKKVSKSSKTDSLRRSTRSHHKPSEWWKTSTNNSENDNDNDNDSSDSSDSSDTSDASSENTYLPPIRRSNDNNKNENTNKNKNNKHKNKNNKHNKNNKSSDKEEKEECDINNINNVHNIKTTFNLLSPHTKQRIDDLPRQINTLVTLADDFLNSATHSIDDIKNVLKDSGLIKKTECELTEKINAQYNEICKNNEIERDKLNKNIVNINDNYIKSQKLLETNMENIMQNIKEIQNDESNETETANEYKILYETSLEKIKLLNNDMINVQNELKICKESNILQNKKTENILIGNENKKRKEMRDLNDKYSLEINDLKLALKCKTSEFNEYKQKTNEKGMINENNSNLLIENLKRENRVLISELLIYKQNNNTVRTVSPNHNINTPTNEYNYNRHIRQSPLNERDKNELISISNVKNLENKIKNLNQEMECIKKQLFAKKELIKEFQIILQKNNIQQKHILNERANDRKIINLYQILTCTQIELNNKEEITDEMQQTEQYKCRTINKENDSMLEYYLSLNALNNPFIDYCLITTRNLLHKLSEGLDSNITFYTKDAPLFVKGLIKQMFIK